MSTCTLVTLAMLALFSVQGRPVYGQSASPQDSGTLQGSVRDPCGQLLASAIVYLQAQGGSQPVIAQTDSAGTYRFPSLRRGMYVLRAKLAGYSDATSGSFVIGENETKSIILALKPLKAETTSSPATATEFFDEPSFTVAGVTDTTNLGGHGSDTIVRTKEALAKDTG